jgi:hypothetical protein
VKKIITLFCSVCVIVCLGTGFTAFAAEAEPAKEPTNVNITVVMPDKTAEPTTEPEPAIEPEVKPSPTALAIILYPSNVEDIRTDTDWTIVKTYELCLPPRTT